MQCPFECCDLCYSSGIHTAQEDVWREYIGAVIIWCFLTYLYCYSQYNNIKINNRNQERCNIYIKCYECYFRSIQDWNRLSIKQGLRQQLLDLYCNKMYTSYPILSYNGLFSTWSVLSKSVNLTLWIYFTRVTGTLTGSMVYKGTMQTLLMIKKSSRAFRMERWRTKDGYMCPLSKKLMIKLLHLKQLQPADFAAFGQTKTLDEQVTFFLNFRG